MQPAEAAEARLAVLADLAKSLRGQNVPVDGDNLHRARAPRRWRRR